MAGSSDGLEKEALGLAPLRAAGTALASALGRGAAAARGGAAALGRGAARAGASLASDLRGAAPAVGENLRFAAGVPAGEAFAPSAGSAARNALRLAFKPRYPGLDRPPGVDALARPLDRTRAALGPALRRASYGATALTGAAGVDTLLRGYPDAAARTAAALQGVNYSEDVAPIRDRARAAAPGVYAELARQAVGAGDASPLSRLVGGAARDTAVPFLRHQVYEGRQNRPGLFAAADTLRSTTPAGALQSLATRWAGRPEPPDVAGAVRARLPAYAAGAAADPAHALSGPFADAARALAADDPSAGRVRRSLLAAAEPFVTPEQLWRAAPAVMPRPWRPGPLDPSYGQVSGAARGAYDAYRAASALRLLGRALPREKSSAERTVDALRRAKAESDRRNFKAKHDIVRRLLASRPHEFVVDSRRAGIVGVTHRGSGFRIHVPARVVPPSVRRAD